MRDSGAQMRRARAQRGRSVRRGQAARRRRVARRRRAALAVLALLVALAVVGISVARVREHSARSQRSAGRRSAAAVPRVAPTRTQLAGNHASGTGANKVVSLRAADRGLTVALAQILKTHTGDLAVGLIDRTTGVRAVYGGGHRFHTASIIKVDILAALLLRHQADGELLSGSDQELATRMIEDSDNEAAQDLWWGDQGADGMAAADASLGLRHTAPDQAGYWGLTNTTVGDQLNLLSDLTSAHSPLNAASRSYALRLMSHVEPGQAWGVTAAATPGTSSAVKNGWLPDPQLWVINSIGVIHHDGHLLLVAILSDDQPTEAGGIAQVKAAAVAAANAATAAHL